MATVGCSALKIVLAGRVYYDEERDIQDDRKGWMCV